MMSMLRLMLRCASASSVLSLVKVCLPEFAASPWGPSSMSEIWLLSWMTRKVNTRVKTTSSTRPLIIIGWMR